MRHISDRSKVILLGVLSHCLEPASGSPFGVSCASPIAALACDGRALTTMLRSAWSRGWLAGKALCRMLLSVTACLVASVYLALCLSGCASPDPRFTRFDSKFSAYNEDFTLSPQHRELRVSVNLYPDQKALSEACQHSPTQPNAPLACADITRLAQGVCILHLQQRTNHLIIGHEFHHCTDGYFHD